MGSTSIRFYSHRSNSGAAHANDSATRGSGATQTAADATCGSAALPQCSSRWVKEIKLPKSAAIASNYVCVQYRHPYLQDFI